MGFFFSFVGDLVKTSARRIQETDLSLISLKNWTELIQYIPNKHHHKQGVKLHPVTNSATRYPLHTPVYCGKKQSGPLSHLVTIGDIVKDLLTQAIIYLWTIFALAHPCRIPLWTSDTNDGPLYSTTKGIPILLNNANSKEKQCPYFTKGLLIVLS